MKTQLCKKTALVAGVIGILFGMIPEASAIYWCSFVNNSSEANNCYANSTFTTISCYGGSQSSCEGYGGGA